MIQGQIYESMLSESFLVERDQTQLSRERNAYTYTYPYTYTYTYIHIHIYIFKEAQKNLVRYSGIWSWQCQTWSNSQRCAMCNSPVQVYFVDWWSASIFALSWFFFRFRFCPTWQTVWQLFLTWKLIWLKLFVSDSSRSWSFSKWLQQWSQWRWPRPKRWTPRVKKLWRRETSWVSWPMLQSWRGEMSIPPRGLSGPSMSAWCEHAQNNS